MSQEKHIVEINGQQYNALTGRLLSDEVGSISMDPAQLMNDILALDNLPIGQPQPDKQRVKPTARLAVGTKKERTLTTTISDITRKPEKSATLMRPAVKKPAHKSEAKRHKETPRIRPVNKTRLDRAKNTPKSGRIKRFHRAVTPNISPTLAKLEVKEQKRVSSRPKPRPQPADWPVIDQFEKAVQEASSHLETFVEKTAKSKKSRKLAYATISLTVLFLAGFGAYHFIPVAKVKMAGNKAGFSASMPGYSPSGFSLSGPITADYGKVTLSYKSRTDDKAFELVQSPSGWSSQALANNFLDATHKQYQTLKGGGHTIYTYNDSNATWVDGGKWYKVEGNAHLSDDQLIKIANSL